jgi:hypothetical protein
VRRLTQRWEAAMFWTIVLAVAAVYARIFWGA